MRVFLRDILIKPFLLFRGFPFSGSYWHQFHFLTFVETDKNAVNRKRIMVLCKGSDKQNFFLWRVYNTKTVDEEEKGDVVI